jgi:hypothetical protein
MSFSSKSAELQKARSIVGSAIQAKQRRGRLQRCRALLRELDPNNPPAMVHAREFSWQYRALRERVHMFSERLSSVDDQERVSDYRLEKAEVAIALSLRYFHDALQDERQHDDDDSADSKP